MNEIPASPTRKILRQAEAEHWLEGFAFLEAAKAQAERELAKVRDVIEESRREGYEAGRIDGERQAAALLVKTTADVNRYMAGLDRQIAELSLAVVEKLLGRFDEAELVARLAQQALQSFQHERDVTITVAPALAERVAELVSRHNTNDMLKIAVLPDPRLDGSKCVLANAVAVVDAGLDTQLSVIRDALLGLQSTRSGSAA
ncbi:type III secretion system stator protein SctL [Sinorhizobium saheli]|uniref:Type 3 secretion system stator protein n=1 Tax=Sinorhizobium saheli TaxID=36856 RepID=A0A178YQV0_SINSA|nr:type III secretion system stator protein SctL [Sinorhizobium saheli]MQW85722.1 HrpE/YscL family type III secretion apparatus protein [Sinorhizobium saheli]OAP49767.1 type III secretion protein [Sinorhizobium saheli]